MSKMTREVGRDTLASNELSISNMLITNMSSSHYNQKQDLQRLRTCKSIHSHVGYRPAKKANVNIKQLVTTVYKYLRGHKERSQGAALAEVARDICEGCG